MSRRELVLGLLLALVLRLGFSIHAFYRPDQPSPDGNRDYEPIALSLLDRGAYEWVPGTPTAQREPGYILFIAGAYAVSGRSPWSVILIQVLVGALTPWLLWRLGAGLFGNFCGRFAFWAAVFYPYFIYYPAYFFRETWLAFFVLGLMLFLATRKDAAGALGAGVFAGLLCSFNGAFAPACGALLPAVVLFGSEKAGRWKRALAFSAPIALFVGPWILRNWLVFHAFVPFSSLVGYQIYGSMLVPYEALGTEEQVRLQLNDPYIQGWANMPEIPWNKAFIAKDVELIRAEPGKFLKSMAVRFVKLWRVMPHQRRFTHSFGAVALAALASDGWLLPLGFFGLWLERRNRFIVLTFGAMMLLVSLAYSISHAPIRYRVPLMPLVLILAGRGAAGLWEAVRARRVRAS